MFVHIHFLTIYWLLIKYNFKLDHCHSFFFVLKRLNLIFFSQFQNLMYSCPSSMILLLSLIVNILRSTIPALWSESNQREGTTTAHVSKPCVTVVKVRTFCFLIEKKQTQWTQHIYIVFRYVSKLRRNNFSRGFILFTKNPVYMTWLKC